MSMGKVYQKVKRPFDATIFIRAKKQRWFILIKDRARAILLATKGATIKEIAEQLDYSTKWVKCWIKRYNHHGLEGLYTRKSSGQPLKLPPGSRGEEIILEMLKNGPPKEGPLTRFRVKDFQEALAREGIHVSTFAIRAKLKSLGFTYKTKRPIHPKNDPKKMEEWKVNFPSVVKNTQDDPKTKGKVVVVFFQDESRYGQQGQLTRSWSPTGERTEEIKQNQFTSGYMITAASPLTGEHFSIVTNCIDTPVMNIFLSDFSESLDENTHALVVLDGASFHHSEALVIPSNITLTHLPPYSPQLNPIENLWGFIKSNFLSGQVYANINEIFSKGCQALNSLTKDIIKSVCHRSYVPGLELS